MFINAYYVLTTTYQHRDIPVSKLKTLTVAAALVVYYIINCIGIITVKYVTKTVYLQSKTNLLYYYYGGPLTILHRSLFQVVIMKYQ